ncbi:uncharacterized protein J8A68_000316 [[Candida] subhashii]|uniref:Uncharacterized protein n=1 Tax=[Candida] subhashii TaxID=561895 RepID=A0A8J5R7B8_9ASCO|nr:uncharacterized protein J8A68_000316 [[Candida] subhashii]KAG7666145.1 hypothetical protein J8A68_000316 [[Candida] subhashii]
MSSSRGRSISRRDTMGDHHQHQNQHIRIESTVPPKRIDRTFKSSSNLQPTTSHSQNRTSGGAPYKNSVTVPNTPRLEHHGGGEPIPPLTRLKSLSKIDIRSPIVPNFSVLLTPSQNFGATVEASGEEEQLSERTSLHTHQTQKSIASRLLKIVPRSFYSVRNFYNDFTTIDWTQAFVSTNRLNYQIKRNYWIDEDQSSPFSSSNDTSSYFASSRRIPFYTKAYFILGKWVLIVLIGFVFSLIAFMIDKIEILLVGFKRGYCKSNWFASQVVCCANQIESNSIAFNAFKSGYIHRENEATCEDWISWATVFNDHWLESFRLDFTIYVVLSVVLALAACFITLTTRITGGSIQSSTSIEGHTTESHESKDGTPSTLSTVNEDEELKPTTKHRVMYTATGSGVPEVKTILSGFVIRRFLGTYTLIAKTIALIFAIASGMSLGKEGPYVHLATCVGNIASRFFPFIHNNELLKKQILSASASAGVALAFGSPLGGVLFILEEINNHLPSNQLFQIFFCAIISTLFLKFLNPYGTGKTVLFELEYFSDWKSIELVFFILIGISGGIFGAAFVKFVKWWPKKFRTYKIIHNHPSFEVFCIALLTGLITFWNPYTKQAAAELVLELATPCGAAELDMSLCPTSYEQYVKELWSLTFALVVKIILTFVTFGLKVPCGIYVPSMVAGALYGRLFAMLIEWINLIFTGRSPEDFMGLAYHFNYILGWTCDPDSKYCVDMGIYAMISAGAFMAGRIISIMDQSPPMVILTYYWH